jgi:hypothetical protein
MATECPPNGFHTLYEKGLDAIRCGRTIVANGSRLAAIIAAHQRVAR